MPSVVAPLVLATPFVLAGSAETGDEDMDMENEGGYQTRERCRREEKVERERECKILQIGRLVKFRISDANYDMLCLAVQAAIPRMCMS